MKRQLLILLPLIGIVATSATLNLALPENYSAQLIPSYVSRDNTPANNQINDAGATLGRVLFYDKRLSSNNSTACASCHHQQFAFGDTASASKGAFGKTRKHAMRLINARFTDKKQFFWEDRAINLEAAATMPIANHEEMGYSGYNGDPDIGILLIRMKDIWYYPRLFSWVYGTPDITEERIQFALSQFIRSIQSFDSKYDIGRALVNDDRDPFPNFTPQENHGKQLFLDPPQFDLEANRVTGGAGCGVCHQAPDFNMIPVSGNNGVTGDFGMDTSYVSPFNVNPPSLRNVVDKNGNPFGGFMHNAGDNGLNTLLDVINHYDDIGRDNPVLDNRLKTMSHPQKLHLTAQEKAALVAFIRTLTGTDIFTNPKWSNPFTSDSLTLVYFPSGISSITPAPKVMIYPTVVTNYVTIQAPASMKNTYMSVADISGRVIYNGPVVEKLDLGSEPAGMYLVRFENGQTEKLVRQ